MLRDSHNIDYGNKYGSTTSWWGGDIFALQNPGGTPFGTRSLNYTPQTRPRRHWVRLTSSQANRKSSTNITTTVNSGSLRPSDEEAKVCCKLQSLGVRALFRVISPATCRVAWWLSRRSRCLDAASSSRAVVSSSSRLSKTPTWREIDGNQG